MACKKVMIHGEPPPTGRIPRHIRTRRNLWLSSNPSYFERASHALTLPLAYDRLIRVYQSAAERQKEGKQQGWARMLESALIRGEAKRDQAVKDRDRIRQEEKEPTAETGHKDGIASKSKGLKALPGEVDAEEGEGVVQNALETSPDEETLQTCKWDKPLGIVPAEELLETTPDPNGTNDNPIPGGDGLTWNSADVVVDGLGKAQALGRWHELLKARFVDGDDEDMDYAELDRANKATDEGWQESIQQDEWFEAEAESWSDDGTERGKKLDGETGVQDF